MIQRAVHMQFGQFCKPADAFIFDHDLRHSACAVRYFGKFRHCGAIKIDANFVKANTALAQKGFGLYANWTGAGAVYLDFVHGSLRVLLRLFQIQYVAHVIQTRRFALQPFGGA